MSFIVVTVSDWHCCNIDYHKSNTLDRNKQYISKNKVWSGTIFWKPFAVVRRQFPFPDCFLFRTVRLQRPGISLWLIARPKNASQCIVIHRSCFLFSFCTFRGCFGQFFRCLFNWSKMLLQNRKVPREVRSAVYSLVKIRVWNKDW